MLLFWNKEKHQPNDNNKQMHFVDTYSAYHIMRDLELDQSRSAVTIGQVFESKSQSKKKI